MKSKIISLNLVIQPISNQDIELYKDEEWLIERLNYSNLYMLAQRPDASFYFPNQTKEQFFPFEIHCNKKKYYGEIDLLSLTENSNTEFDTIVLNVEQDPRRIRIPIYNQNIEENIEVVEWFTVEKMIYDKSKKHYTIKGLDNYLELTNYFLLYVGISKKENSLKRLIKRGHLARTQILPNEFPSEKKFRITDEIILFFFKVDEMDIRGCDSEKDIESLFDEINTNIEVVSDAEKAFIKILDSKYNVEKYKKYPKGKDGLFGKGFDRYIYLINEDITFRTEFEMIKGKYNYYKEFSGHIDFIYVEGENVCLIKHDDLKK